MKLILNETDVGNIIEMLRREQSIVDRSKNVLNETEKMHAIIYLKELERKIIKQKYRGKK